MSMKVGGMLAPYNWMKVCVYLQRGPGLEAGSYLDRGLALNWWEDGLHSSRYDPR